MADIGEILRGGLDAIPGAGPVLGEVNRFDRNTKLQQARAKRERIKRWKSINSGTLTVEECAQLWVDAGGKEEDAAMAAVITRPESGGRVDIVNSIGATGLWQIYPGGPQYKNAWNNAKTAVAKRRGKPTTWGPNPWAVCVDAKCSNLAAEAAALDRKLNLAGTGGIIGDLPLPSVDNPLAGIEAVAKAVSGVANAIGALVQFLLDLAAKLVSPEFWKDALMVMVGVWLLLIGTRKFLQVAGR